MVVNYLPRILDDDLEKYLTMIGAILIVGPKWCGKTTTAEQHAKSVLKLQDKDNYKTNMNGKLLQYYGILSETAWMKAKDMDYIF